MKKLFILGALFLSTGVFAKCGSINLGFVTIITGTYQELVMTGYNSNLEPIYEVVTKPCSEGNRWQWFWE